MKRFLLFVVTAAMLGGCKKEPDPDPVPGNKTSRVSARINGTSWTAEEALVQQAGSGLSISGRKDDGTGKSASLLVYLKQYGGLSTYVIDSAVWSDVSGTYTGTSGTLTVSTDNSVHIAGSFSFEAVSGASVKSITEGSFDYYK